MHAIVEFSGDTNGVAEKANVPAN